MSLLDSDRSGTAVLLLLVIAPTHVSLIPQHTSIELSRNAAFSKNADYCVDVRAVGEQRYEAPILHVYFDKPTTSRIFINKSVLETHQNAREIAPHHRFERGTSLIRVEAPEAGEISLRITYGPTTGWEIRQTKCGTSAPPTKKSPPSGPIIADQAQANLAKQLAAAKAELEKSSPARHNQIFQRRLKDAVAFVQNAHQKEGLASTQALKRSTDVQRLPKEMFAAVHYVLMVENSRFMFDSKEQRRGLFGENERYVDDLLDASPLDSVFIQSTDAFVTALKATGATVDARVATPDSDAAVVARTDTRLNINGQDVIAFEYATSAEAARAAAALRKNALGFGTPDRQIYKSGPLVVTTLTPHNEVWRLLEECFGTSLLRY